MEMIDKGKILYEEKLRIFNIKKEDFFTLSTLYTIFGKDYTFIILNNQYLIYALYAFLCIDCMYGLNRSDLVKKKLLFILF